MTIQNYFVLTSAERTAALAFNTEEIEINPRAIDNASPGTGINLNDNASSYDPGNPVTLTAAIATVNNAGRNYAQPMGA